MPKKSSVNSRAKGARGEREAAKVITVVLGVPARRGQQFSGGPESPDVVVDVEGVHWEVKRVENLNITKAVKQAIKDAGPDKTPVVLHRKNGEEWLLTTPFKDVPPLVRKLIKYIGLENES